MNYLKVHYLGRRDFNKTWKYQRSLFEKRRKGVIPDTLLLVEHDPVFTIGKTGSKEIILSQQDGDPFPGIPIVPVDRGGDVTFHGPGQLVGYPILNLADYYPDLHRYLRDLEEVIIRTLDSFGIDAGREKGLTGVWVGDAKIAAIGVKVTRWITMHGFALNVFTDLRYFEMINPCGIKKCKTTSMKQITGEEVPLEYVADKLAEHFRDAFIPKKSTVSGLVSEAR